MANKGGFKKTDKRRYSVKGNKNAADKRRSVYGRGNFITQQLIATLHDAYLEVKEGNERASKTDMTVYAKMCKTLAYMACGGDLEAMKFIFERIEGKVPQPVHGRIEHQHRIEQQLSLLSDDELEQFENLSRKLLEGEGPVLIEHQPEPAQ